MTRHARSVRWIRPRLGVAAGLGVAGALFLTAPAAQADVSEFRLPAGADHAGLYRITAGPDAAMWFTERGVNRIGRISTVDGSITSYGVSHEPSQITTGPDGNIWFTEPSGFMVGRITTGSRTVTEFTTPESAPEGIAAGADGNVWYAGRTFPSGGTASGIVGRLSLSPTTHVDEFPAGTCPGTMVSAPDARLWAVDQCDLALQAVSTAGTVTPYRLRPDIDPSATDRPSPTSLTVGPDGALWVSMHNPFTTVSHPDDWVTRMTTAGTETDHPSRNYAPADITAAGGSLWTAGNSALERMETDGASTVMELEDQEYPGPSFGFVTGVATAGNGNVWWVAADHQLIGCVPVNGAALPCPPSTIPDHRGGAGTGTGAPTGTGDPSAGGLPVSSPAVPVLRSLAIAPARLRAAASGPTLARRSGASLTFRLSRKARVGFVVTRRSPGWRAHGRCVAKKPSRRARSCVRQARIGKGFASAGTAGLNRLRFSGRLGGRRLAPARYTLHATPRAGGRSGTTRSVRFRVVR